MISTLAQALDGGKDLALKFLAIEFGGAGLERGGVEGSFFEAIDGGAERSGCGFFKELGVAFAQGFQNATGAERDDGGSGRQRLQGGDSEVLDAGENEAARAKKVVDDFGPGHISEELDVRVGHGFQPFLLLSGADDFQSPAGVTEGLDREVDALVRREGGDHQVKVVAFRFLCDCEIRELNEWVNDLGVAVIEPANPLADESGVGDHVIDVGVALEIPRGEGIAEQLHSKTLSEGGIGSEIHLILIVEITHWAVDVGDVQRSRRFRDAFDHAVGAGQHQIDIVRKLEIFSGLRHERQKFSIMSLHMGNSIEEGCFDSVGFDRWAALIWNVDQRVDRSLGEESAKRLEDAFSAPKSREPVVKEGDLHVKKRLLRRGAMSLVTRRSAL